MNMYLIFGKRTRREIEMKFERYAHSDDLDFQEKVDKQLLFRKIISVSRHGEQDAELMLDNGIVLRVEGNRGCGGCDNGWFYLTELNKCDNAITRVECTDESEETYTIYVYAENEKIKLLQYEGYDNGYYGTGYEMIVSVKD